MFRRSRGELGRVRLLIYLGYGRRNNRLARREGEATGAASQGGP
jgi:hypothetical protein